VLLGCEDQVQEEPKVKEKVSSCDLSYDKLNDSEWLFLRSEQGKPDSPDIKSRIKFYNDGSLKAKYTVASLSDLYEYSCTEIEGRLICKQTPDFQRWCETLMANGRKCSLSSFKKLDSTLTESDEMKKGVAAAGKIFAKQKDSKGFKRYKNKFNSLGNKLQGVMYVDIDEKNCRLRVTDNYMTFYNKKRLEDSNPNGINAFVKNEVGELLWEDCETSQLFDTTFSEYPKNPEDIQPIGKHAVGTEVHYWMLHDPLRYAEKGCEYSFDVYHNYLVDQKGLKPSTNTAKGKTELMWHFAKKYAKASDKTQPEILMLVTKTKCGDKPEKKITGCNKVKIQ